MIINGILGAIPAFIIRFIFQKRFTGGKAILISFLLTFLSTFVQTAMENHHPAAFGSSITFGISMMLLLKKSDKSNKKAINPSSQTKEENPENNEINCVNTQGNLQTYPEEKIISSLSKVTNQYHSKIFLAFVIVVSCFILFFFVPRVAMSIL